MDKKFNEKSREIIAEYLDCNVDDVYCVCGVARHCNISKGYLVRMLLMQKVYIGN